MSDSKNYNEVGMYWVESDSDAVESKKWAERVVDLLSDKANNVDTVTMSRYAGAAIQFFNPTGYFERRERELEEELEREGVSVRASEIPTVFDENNYFSDANTELVDEVEFGRIGDEIEGERMQISLPESVVESAYAEVDDLESYNRNQLARYISNCVLAFDASIFSCLAERVETKEQLLKAVRGETVEEPTPVFEKIRDGDVFESVQADVFEREEVIDSLEEIDTEDDVVLEEGHPVHNNTWGSDGLELKKTDGRAGVFMAYFRGLVEKYGGDGFPKVFFINHIRERTDYNAEYVFGEYIKEHLTEGPDGDWYVYEENAPEAVEESIDADGLAQDIVLATKPRKQGRSAKAALKRSMSDSKVAEICRASSGEVDASILVGEVEAGNIDVSDLVAARDYLYEGLPEDVLRRVMSDAETVDKETASQYL